MTHNHEAENAAGLTPEQLAELAVMTKSKPALHAIVEAARQHGAAIVENAAYRRAYGCIACGEDHQTNTICPPHECRTTGLAWYDEKMRAAVARAEKAEAERDEARRMLGVYADAKELRGKRDGLIAAKSVVIEHGWNPYLGAMCADIDARLAALDADLRKAGEPK